MLQILHTFLSQINVSIKISIKYCPILKLLSYSTSNIVFPETNLCLCLVNILQNNIAENVEGFMYNVELSQKRYTSTIIMIKFNTLVKDCPRNICTVVLVIANWVHSVFSLL